jgi:transposase, IS5 family
MGQLGFFDADKRLAALSAKGDPLEAIDRLVPWETFRADIEAVVLTPEEMRKSSARQEAAGCDCDVSNAGFAGLNNLSDEQAEYQVRDRRSFTDFCGWAWRTAFLTPPPSGCSARSWPRPG